MWRFSHTALTSEVIEAAEKMFESIDITKQQKYLIEHAAYVACMNENTTEKRIADFIRVLGVYHLTPEEISAAEKNTPMKLNAHDAGRLAAIFSSVLDLESSIVFVDEIINEVGEHAGLRFLACICYTAGIAVGKHKARTARRLSEQEVANIVTPKAETT